MVYYIRWCNVVVSVHVLGGLVALLFIFQEVEMMSNIQESTVVLKASAHIASYRFVTSDLRTDKSTGTQNKGL